MQKVRLYFNGICALACMINKLVEQIVPLQVGSELLQLRGYRCFCFVG